MTSWLTITFREPVITNLSVGVNDDFYPIQKGSSHCKLKYLKNYDDKFLLRIKTLDKSIYNNTVTITQIQFEDFWTISDNKILMTAISHDSKIFVESTNDHNTLFFLGELNFEFYHPIGEFLNDPLCKHRFA